MSGYKGYDRRLWGLALAIQALALLMHLVMGYMIALGMTFSNVSSDTLSGLKVLSGQVNSAHQSAQDTLDAIGQSAYLTDLIARLGHESLSVSTAAGRELSEVINAHKINYPAFDQLFLVTGQYIVSGSQIQPYEAPPGTRNFASQTLRAELAADILRSHLGVEQDFKTDYNVLISNLGDGAFLAALVRDETLFSGSQAENLYVLDERDRFLHADQMQAELYQAIVSDKRAYFKGQDFARHGSGTTDFKLYRFSGERYVPVEYMDVDTGNRYLQLVSLDQVIGSLRQPLWVNGIIALLSFALMACLLWRLKAWVFSPMSELLNGARHAREARQLPASMMRRLQRKRQLQFRVFAFFCLTLVPVVLMAPFTYAIYAPHIQRAAQNAYQQTVLQKASALEEKVNQTMLMARRLGSDMDLREVMKRIGEGERQLEPRALQALQGAGVLGQSRGVRLYDEAGALQFSTNRRDEAVALPAGLLELYQNSYAFAVLDIDDTDPEDCRLYFPIRNLESTGGKALFSCIGYVEIQLQGLLNPSYENSNFDYVFDRSQWKLVGTSVYAPLRKLAEGMAQGALLDMESPMAGRMVAVDYARLPASESGFLPHDGAGIERMLVTACTVEGTDWTFLNIARLNDMEKQQAQMLRYILMLSLMILLAVTLISALFTFRMLRPIRALERYFLTAQPGDAQIPEGLVPVNEFSALAYAFSGALKRIEQLTNAVRDRERAQLILKNRKNEAEIIALQSQMDSHLIYNIFAAMKLLLRSGDMKTLATMLDASGDFLRNGLVHGGYDVSMEQELKHVKAYVQLQKVRYGPRLKVEFEAMDPELNRALVPQYLLQPIFENAIVHGMPPKQTLHIRMSGRVEGRDMVFEVENDGLPIEEADCERINHSLNRDQAGAHIGLANIQERIRLRYGAAYGLCLTSRDGRTCVSIHLPREGGAHDVQPDDCGRRDPDSPGPGKGL